jgi:linoleoyl-CoA desaturase
MTIRFEKSELNLLALLRKKVNFYFAENKISPFGNIELYLKTGILFGVLALNYILQVTSVLQGFWPLTISYLLQGILFALIGFNVMHDGSHFCYSGSSKINAIMAHSLNFLGGIALFWHQKHVVNHHTYTNLEGVDDDIDLKPFLRVHENQKRLPFHRFQAFYALILYSFTYLFWIYYRDFKKYFSGKIADETQMQSLSRKDHFTFWLTKLGHAGLFIGLPCLLVGPTQAIGGYLLLGFSCGITLALVFQLAHIVEGTHFPARNEEENYEIGAEWSLHQIQTTVNFDTQSKVMGWLLGGLNFQMVHHLFPRISHVHYPAIHRIICDTCKEQNVPFVEFSSFREALFSHFRHLHQMGKPIAA